MTFSLTPVQPIRIFLYCLLGLAVSAVFFSTATVSDLLLHLAHFGLLLGSSLVTRWLIGQTKLVAPPAMLLRWEHRLITSLLLFLLFNPAQPWGIFLLLGILTEALERFVRVPTGPVANPAGLGALLLALAGYYPDWWGMSFGPRLTIGTASASLITWLFLLTMVWVVSRYKKFWTVLVALLSFCLLYLVGLQQSPLGVVLDGTFLFFLMVMLVEPKTSPTVPQEQMWFGGVAAALVVVFLKTAFVEAYLGALIVTESGFQMWRYRQRLIGWLRPNS